MFFISVKHSLKFLSNLGVTQMFWYFSISATQISPSISDAKIWHASMENSQTLTLCCHAEDGASFITFGDFIACTTEMEKYQCFLYMHYSNICYKTLHRKFSSYYSSNKFKLSIQVLFQKHRNLT